MTAKNTINGNSINLESSTESALSTLPISLDSQVLSIVKEWPDRTKKQILSDFIWSALETLDREAIIKLHESFVKTDGEPMSSRDRQATLLVILRSEIVECFVRCRVPLNELKPYLQ